MSAPINSQKLTNARVVADRNAWAFSQDDVGQVDQIAEQSVVFDFKETQAL